MKTRDDFSAQFMIGCALMVVYQLIVGALDVYVGSLTQHTDELRLLFWSFFIATALFVSKQGTRFPTLVRRSRADTGTLLWLNATTALTWGAFFYALKYAEPLLVATVSSAFAPLLTAFLTRYFRPGTPVNTWENLAAKGIFVVLGIVLWLTLSGRSGLGDVSPAIGLLGFGASVICGIAMTLNPLFSKRLADRGYTTGEVMALRFWFLCLSALGVLLMKGPFLPQSREEVVAIFLIALVSNVAGLSLLQKAIEKLEPITVSLFLAAAPLFTVPFQLLDRRLLFSFPSVATSLGVIVLVFVGIFSRSRKQGA